MFLSNIKRVFVLLFILSLFLCEFVAQEDSDEDVDSDAGADDDSEDGDEGEDGDEIESTTTEMTTTTTTAKTKTSKSGSKVAKTMATTAKEVDLMTTSTAKPMATDVMPKGKGKKQESNDKKDEEGSDGGNGDEDDEYEDEDEGNGSSGGDDDYFEEMTSEDMLKSLIQRSFAISSDANVSDVRNRTADQMWIEFLTQVDNGLQSLVRAITPTALDAFYTMPELSPSCSNSLLRIATGLQQTQEWAFRMLDSNGKFPTGLMSGTLSSLGAYDQCMETVAIEEGEELFRGQYCLLKLRPPMPTVKGRLNYYRPYISLNGSKYANTWMDRRIAGRYATGFYSTHVYNGLCLPSTCAQRELNTIIKKYIESFEVSIDYCDHRIDAKNIKTFIARLNVPQMIAIIIIIVSIILVLLATVVEYFGPDYIKLMSPFGRLIACFSIITNIRKLFRVQNEKSDPNLQFIHGIRVLTMIWIIMIHTFTVGTLFVPMLIYRFEDEARKFGKQLSTQFIFNGYISVSNFFFVSGLVASYISVPIMTRTGGPTFFKYMSLRWFRFVPALIGAICFHILWPLIGSGPVFKGYAEELTKPCAKNWWTNILFVNNWFLLPDMCLVHTWFLSADFQLHVLSYFALFALSRSKGAGVVMSTAFILLGIVIPSLVTYRHQAPPIPMPFEEPDIDQFYRDLNTQYHPTYNHLSTYFVGVLVGYLLLKRENNLNFSFTTKLLSWTVLPALTLGAVFATYLWTGLEWDYSRVTAATYNGLHRFVYILFFVWIAFYCSANHKSILNRFLSSKLFIPLSRLSFSMYLTHLLVVWYFVLETRELIRFTYADFVYSTGGVILYSLFTSLALYLLFESVWSNVLNLICKKHPKNDLKSTEIQTKFGLSSNDSKSESKHMKTNGVNKWKGDGRLDCNGNAVQEYNVYSMTSNGAHVDVGRGGGERLHPTAPHINIKNINTKL